MPTELKHIVSAFLALSNNYSLRLISSLAAPECFRDDRFWDESNLQAKQNVDIFSYGCVLSEAAVWMAKGYRGLLNYRSSRAIANESNKELRGCFHDGKSILSTVFEFHNSLKLVLRACDRTTPEVLRIIEEEILLEESDARLDAKQLWYRAKSLINSGKASTWSGLAHELGQPGPSNVPSPPSASRKSLSTPLKRSDSYTSIAKSNINPDAFILSDPEIEEPDSMSNYRGNYHFPLEYSRANLSSDRSAEHWDRIMSAPGPFVEQLNVPLSLLANRNTAPAMGEALERDQLNGGQLSQTIWPRQTRPTTYHRIGAFVDSLNRAKVASTAQRRAAISLPVLSISAAIEWKRGKKENELLFNRFRKREVPRLQGEWLLSRVRKRDHVRLNPCSLLVLSAGKNR